MKSLVYRRLGDILLNRDRFNMSFPHFLPIDTKLYRSALSIFFNQGGVFILGFLGSVVLARVLEPASRGLLAEIMVYPALVASFLQMGVRQSVVYEVGRGHYTTESIVGNVLTLVCVLTPIGLLSTCFLIHFFSPSHFSHTEIMLAVAPLAFVLIKSYSGGLFLGQQRIGSFNMTELLPSALRFVGVVLFVWLVPLGVSGALLAGLVSTSIGSYYILKVILEEVKIVPLCNRGVMRDLLGRGVVYAFAILLSQLNYKFDIVLLSQLSAPEETGLYSVAVAIPMLILQVPAAVGLAVMSGRANADKHSHFDCEVRRGVMLSMLFGVLASLILYYFAPIIIHTIYGAEYDRSVSMFQLILPGVVAMVGYKILAPDFAGMGRPWLLIAITAPSLALNLVLNYLLIPHYGGNGAALSSTGSYVLTLFIAVLLHRKLALKRSSIPGVG